MCYCCKRPLRSDVKIVGLNLRSWKKHIFPKIPKKHTKTENVISVRAIELHKKHMNMQPCTGSQMEDWSCSYLAMRSQGWSNTGLQIHLQPLICRLKWPFWLDTTSGHEFNMISGQMIVTSPEVTPSRLVKYYDLARWIHLFFSFAWGSLDVILAAQVVWRWRRCSNFLVHSLPLWISVIRWQLKHEPFNQFHVRGCFCWFVWKAFNQTNKKIQGSQYKYQVPTLV